jgi:hypothetical protein
MPATAYNSNFIVSALTYGFDVRTDGYTRRIEANRTIRVIPFSPTYAVTVQTAGINPKEREYRLIFYTEVAFQAMMNLVGATGVLTTPREPSANAYLDSCESDDMTNSTTATGELTARLHFTLV